MLLKIACHPPLGTDTHHEIRKGSEQVDEFVRFVVLLEDAFLLHDVAVKWEVELWHNMSDKNAWNGLQLKQSSDLGQQVDCLTPFQNCSWYHGHLPLTSSSGVVSFTVRAKLAGIDSGWRWARDVNGSEDGRLFYHARHHLHAFSQSDVALSPSNSQIIGADSFQQFVTVPSNSSFEITQVPSDVPETLLWRLDGALPASENETAGHAYFTIGEIICASRWFALVRQSTAWLAPRQGPAGSFAERDAMLYVFERTDGLHVALLAVSDYSNSTAVRTGLCGDAYGIAAKAYNDCESRVTTLFVCTAVGDSFDLALAATVYYVRKRFEEKELSNLDGLRSGYPNFTATQDSSRKIGLLETHEWFDGLSYYTWNSLGPQLSVDKISEAMTQFKDNGIHVSNVIIDDGWQSLNDQDHNGHELSWSEFEANPKKFPHGLKAAIARLKSENPGVKNFAVWHALLGYWSGFSSCGGIARRYKTMEVTRSGPISGSDRITVVQAGEVESLYSDFYSFLADCGITAVKTDVQAVLEEIVSSRSRRELTSAYMRAWTHAYQQHFDDKAIYSMSQSPSNIFSNQITTRRQLCLMRNSDDYFPDEKDAHPWHVYCNAHNALFTSYLNIIPDWDMFQTGHPWGAWHAAARCLSGGPISVTDIPGQHDVALIRKIVAPTPDKRTVAFRPSVVGRSASPYIGSHAKFLCRIVSYNGDAISGSALIGLFNCHSFPLVEIIPFESFSGLGSGLWIVRSFRTGRISQVFSAKCKPVLGAKVDGHEWEILTASRVLTVHNPTGSHAIQVADLGLTSHMTGACAVLSRTLRQRPEGTEHIEGCELKTIFKALGVWSVWVSFTGFCLDDCIVTLQGVPIAKVCVSLKEEPNDCGCVVSADLRRAWSDFSIETKQDSGKTVEANLYVKMPAPR